MNIGQREINIPKNATAREVTKILSDNRIVRIPAEFLFFLKLTGKESSIRSGRYQLQVYKNPIYVIDKLVHGGRSDIAITIPEGLTLREIAKILYEKNLIDNQDKFVELCNDKNFIKRIGLNVSSLEGYLFPDTYSFEQNEGPIMIVSKMIENLKNQIRKISIIPIDSLQTTIIIASLVEKEAKYNEERPIIARVFYNRLKSNRPLESCATVIYAKKLKNPDITITYLLERDLKIDSPYNTYLHSGLPPSPICSPGINSIKAALFPADVDYLYFVAKGDGYHHFSKTYKEHLEAKEYYNAKK
ncbi:MAG: endolytic transglycosylase MltG [candidate division WOR-3 bacterium]